MVVKTYGLFDIKAKNFVRTFVSENDDTAERAAKYIVREKGFDPITGCDMTIKHLFDFDSVTGQIIDNEIRDVCQLREAFEELKAEGVIHE